MYSTIEYKHLKSVSSTNDWMKDSLHLCTPGRLVCVRADEQTAGRGRNNHVWLSEENTSLMVTYGFGPLKDIAHIGSIGQVLAISCIQVLDSIPLMFKWPNDLYISKKKCGGILCEVIKHNEKFYVVCGLGLNVNNQHGFKIDQPHTSLYLETNKLQDLSSLSMNLSALFLENLNLWLEKGFSPFLSMANDHLLYQGDQVTITQDTKKTTGTCVGLTIDGAIQLNTSSGRVNFTSGSLTLN